MLRSIVLALMLVGTGAFAPVSRAMPRARALDASILDTLAETQGPAIYWGSDGVLEGKDENDIKGHEAFGKFIAAAKASGLLDGAGPYTVFAPIDSAFDNLNAKDITDPAVMKYHIIDGSVSYSAISGDQMTMAGKALTYKRFARQTFLDDAVIGIVPQGPATGQVFPKDVQCDNGVVHTIDQILDPAWTKVAGDAGQGGVV